ncbi:sensor histidine kinase [Chitinophaga sp. S165]|uniref:sensor histidine kinase n=1 Tax=Chitinophaga sp. S165 TaxID=2135462 RepID=UPI001304F30B|nr:sensor histidine kinase [Chitinophaga sp. S165]
MFWCLSYYYLLHLFSAEDIKSIDLIYTAVYHFPLMAGVYLNLYLLIPWLLSRKRYVLYAVLLGITVILSALLTAFIFGKAIDYLLPGYYFISYYELADLAQFSIVYIGLTTLITLSRAWFKLLESENYQVRAQKKKKDAELLFLKTQINPHFLFNSLNSIYSLALKKDAQTPAVLLKLAEVMRYMTYETNEEHVLLEKEIQYIRNYIELQKLRAGSNAHILFEMNGEPGAQRISPFILIVFIENGFKHGIQGGINDTFIDIRIDLSGNELILTVANNIGAVDETENDDFRGLGLNNVKKRLELLYFQKHELTIRNDGERFNVQLKLDLSNPLTFNPYV